MGDDAKLYMEMQELEFCNWVERLYGKCDGFEECGNKTEFSRYFFVDYENVNREGLNGIKNLSREDCVRIYYSDSAETLTFGLHRRINASKAYFEYIKVQIPIKNAVDCQILFDVRDLAKEHRNTEYYIVSKDSDYDKAIEEFNEHNIKVKKVLEVCKIDEPVQKEQVKKTEKNQVDKDKVQAKKSNTKVEDDKRESQVRSFFGQNLKKKVYVEHKEEIIAAILNSKSKQQVNNNLVKIYKNKTASEIYKKIKTLIKDLPGR